MPEHPILDPAVLDALVALSPGDNGAFVRELIDIFLQDSRPRLEEIENSLTQGDTTTASRAAHAIKGSCGNFGATRLHASSLTMEKTAERGDLEAARALLPGLREDYEATLRELEKVRARLQ
jgi:HPt (histidine-containing phosphotransfer) domain-containing protein